MATKATAPGKSTGQRQVGIAKLEGRVNTLEEKLNTVLWLHAELSYAIKAAMAAQLAQQMQPQIQQAIMQRMMNPGASPSPPPNPGMTHDLNGALNAFQAR